MSHTTVPQGLDTAAERSTAASRDRWARPRRSGDRRWVSRRFDWALVGRIGLWVTIPVAGATWVSTTISQHYPAYDDWVIIDRATSGSWLREMFIGFNGHLWSLAYWAYHLQ